MCFHDPAPTLRHLETPTLALWGGLDNNIVADRNKPAWDAALEHRAEVAQALGAVMLQTVEDWLAKRIRGFR